MKKVIDGKLYNTKTADLICERDNGYYWRDFNYCSECLYRTKKGSWFIYGDGNGRDSIEPITKDEAFQWMQEHNFKETDKIVEA